MKKLIIVFFLTSSLFGKVEAQVLDDRLVTQHLAINTSLPGVEIFVSRFREGFDKGKSGTFNSMDDVATHYGFDIRELPSLDQQLNNSLGGASVYSSSFLTKLKAIVDHADQFENIYNLRSEYVKIARAGNLSVKETEALALIDITTQEMVKKTATSNGNSLFEANSMTGIRKAHIRVDDFLPRWLICILGTVSTTVTSTLSGASLGSTIGSVLGPPGAALGGLIGGAIGLVSGVSNGINNFCR